MSPTEIKTRLHTISNVERDAGIAKDTLRIWERRYGFPSPERNNKGERHYPDDQVKRLITIRKLLDHGMRPNSIVTLDTAELEALANDYLGTFLEREIPADREELLTAVQSGHATSTGSKRCCTDSLRSRGWRPASCR